jgi:hypothetical protein
MKTKKQLYVHVGMPKTATSFLQRFIFPQIKDVFYIDRSNIYYNDLFKNLALINDYCGEKEKVIDHFIKYVFSQKENKILISDEAWFGGVTGALFLNYSNHKNLVKYLRKINLNTKIIITIRKQADYIESLYKHSIRDGYHSSLNKFLNKKDDGFSNFKQFDISGPNIDVYNLDYLKYIQQYIKFFGKENVLIIPQEAIKNDFHDFERILMSFLGINQKLRYMDVKVNKGLSSEGLRITKFFNPLFRFPNRQGGILPNGRYLEIQNKKGDLNFFSTIMRKFDPYKMGKLYDKLIKSKKQILDYETYNSIYTFYKDKNKELNKSCDFDLKKYNYF